MKTLKERFKQQFLIGAAVNGNIMKENQDLLKMHYNSITAENEMKFEEICPEPGLYNFELPDQFLAFAEEHGIGMRGHTLVWHNQTPAWFFMDDEGNDVSREELLKRLHSHINTVVKRYRGRVYAWDVVNEAVSDHGEEVYRPSKWTEIIGEDFLDYAFQYAHEADPNALLFYNDYNETNPVKREKIYRLVKGMLARNVPIHGIGLQAHWSLYHPAYEEIEEALKRYSELGLTLHITEMDVSVYAFDDKRTDLVKPTEEMLHLQAERYEHFFKLFEAYAENISAVTFWGVTDNYTWLNNFPVKGRKNWPFLFDANAVPKPAFYRVIK